MKKSLTALALAVLLAIAAAANPPTPPELPPDAFEAIQTEHHPLLLDVRDPEEIRESGSLEGYVNIPLQELEQRLDELPRDRQILTA
jgi:rhodanese-related sulfurtransferase